MKRIVTIVLVLIMAFGCVACSGAKSADKETHLTVWYWGEQEIPGYKAYMEEMAQKYSEANKGVTVEVVLQESDTLYSAFRAAESAGEAPDVAFMWGGSLCLEDAWMGNLAPISDYLTKEQLSVMDPNALRETNWDGKQWGFPAYSIVWGVAYNKKMMEAVGVDPNDPYTTWEEFINVCQKLKDAGYTPIGGGLKDGWLPGWLAFYFGQQNYDNTNDAIACFKRERSYTDPKCSAWLSNIEELITKGYYNDDVQSLDFYQGQQLLESGDAAMTLHTHAYAATVAQTMGDDTIGFAMQPICGTGKLATDVIAASQVFVIPKSSQHKEEGAKFLMFLQEEENLKSLYDHTKARVPNVNFKPEWLTSAIDQKVAEFTAKYPTFLFQYVYPSPFEYEGLVPVIQKMFEGTIDVATAAEELDAAIAKWCEQSPDQLDAYKKWNLD